MRNDLKATDTILKIKTEDGFTLAAGRDGVEAIKAARLKTPSGWMDCAEIHYQDETAVKVIPLYRLDSFDLLRAA